jgi:hypothetical protein
VDVLVDRSRHDVAVLVRDSGVGIPDWRLEQFNEAFENPPAIDISAIRSMGLTVVAHIAAWHGIGVRLQPGPEYGTVAEIIMPSSVCRVRFAPAKTRPLTQAASAPAWPRRSGLVPAPRQSPDPPIYRGVARGFAGFLRDSASNGSWQGVADSAWAAAARTSTPERGQPNRSGLPRRPPMANLVPGSVPGQSSVGGAVDHRDPSSIAAAMAAFAFGSANRRHVNPET